MADFDHTIYTEPNGPFRAWLDATREKVDFQSWLIRRLPTLLAECYNRTVRVLDMGCSTGLTSIRLMHELSHAGFAFEFTGVDPYQAQLDRFKGLAEELMQPVTLIQGTAEDFQTDETYDLVVANHCLYYTSDMREAIRNLMRLGHRVVIVHHGERGINQFHKAFPGHVHEGPHIISTHKDVLETIHGLDLRGRTVHEDGYTSKVDIAWCSQPNSHIGRQLLSFFLERDTSDLPPKVRQELGAFAVATWPHMTMLHDVHVITIA